MCIRVQGQSGQDDGNKHNKGYIDNHGRTGQTLLIGPIAVNSSF